MNNSIVNPKLTAFAAAVLLCCSVMLPNSAVKAQSCPGQIVGCPAWTQVTVITSTDGTPLNGADSALCAGSSPTCCCVSITFCYVCCAGVIYTDLDDVQPNANCTLSPDQLIDFADWYASTWALYQYFGQGDGCDPKQNPCPSWTEIVFDAAECWELNTIVGNNVYTQCAADNCECETTCQVCWNPVTMQLTYSNYEHTTRGGTCDCPPEPTGAWTPNTCYTILCPDGKGGHL
jgi:hypothetical protein